MRRSSWTWSFPRSVAWNGPFRIGCLTAIWRGTDSWIRNMLQWNKIRPFQLSCTSSIFVTGHALYIKGLSSTHLWQSSNLCQSNSTRWNNVHGIYYAADTVELAIINTKYVVNMAWLWHQRVANIGWLPNNRAPLFIIKLRSPSIHFAKTQSTSGKYDWISYEEYLIDFGAGILIPWKLSHQQENFELWHPNLKLERRDVAPTSKDIILAGSVQMSAELVDTRLNIY